MNITFGNKIPEAKCKIYDTKAKKFVKSTLYEIDCKDKEDIEYIKKINGNWRFMKWFINGADNKHNAYEYDKDIFSKSANYNFYVLETDKGDVAGIMQTIKLDKRNVTNVKYIESDPKKKFKYAGQTMLEKAAKKCFKTPGAKLKISSPAPSAYSFYTDKCGFEIRPEGLILQEGSERAKKFIDNVENITKGKS